MAQPPPQPGLTPQFCFSSGALRDFLRLSRATVDDSISQNLNALVTPSREGFDPSSTSTRSPRAFPHRVDPGACASFRDRVLLPTWRSRSDVLDYCAAVAAAPDPGDPEAALREAEVARGRDRVVDERLDPYSARFFPREARTERLAAVLRTERGVEDIVRTRTWAVVKERCGENVETWEEALERWGKERDSGKS